MLCSLKAAISGGACACSFHPSQYRNHEKVMLKHRLTESAPIIGELLNWCRKYRIKRKIICVRYPTIAGILRYILPLAIKLISDNKRKGFKMTRFFMGYHVERKKIDGHDVWGSSVRTEGLLDSFISKWADKAVQELLLSIWKHEKNSEITAKAINVVSFLLITYQSSLCFTMSPSTKLHRLILYITFKF